MPSGKEKGRPNSSLERHDRVFPITTIHRSRTWHSIRWNDTHPHATMFGSAAVASQFPLLSEIQHGRRCLVQGERNKIKAFVGPGEEHEQQTRSAGDRDYGVFITPRASSAGLVEPWEGETNKQQSWHYVNWKLWSPQGPANFADTPPLHSPHTTRVKLLAVGLYNHFEIVRLSARPFEGLPFPSRANDVGTSDLLAHAFTLTRAPSGCVHSRHRRCRIKGKPGPSRH